MTFSSIIFQTTYKTDHISVWKTSSSNLRPFGNLLPPRGWIRRISVDVMAPLSQLNSNSLVEVLAT